MIGKDLKDKKRIPRLFGRLSPDLYTWSFENMAEMEHLFAYGTLMCEDIMREISGFRLSHEKGILKGYSRRSVKGEHYPALVPDETGRVEGILYRDIPDSAWERLDRFEGEMYERRLVQVGLNSGTILFAATYVARPAFLDQLDKSDWDFSDFIRNGKAIFQKHYKGYRSL
jgi:gamma-glutamylcyclotransferase (GGCT)/AIG2-like uncharacterized protein YtfP